MTNQLPKVRTQNLRDFTVQIRHAITNAIVGTGFIVSIDGKVITCIHVVKDASVENELTEGIEVGVYFPQGNIKKLHRAKVIAYFSESADDIVLLQVLSSELALLPQNIAVLGNANNSNSHPFESYGYRRLAKYQAGRAEGKILGDVEPPEECILRADPIQLKSSEINAGMSGAAVLDVADGRNLVVGVISETWFSDEFQKDRDTAWAVNASILASPPFSLPIQDLPVPLKEGLQPKTDVEAARAKIAISLLPNLNQAPALFDEWVGREELLATLDADWLNSQHCVTGLIGFGGEGKSSLARKWVDTLLRNSALPQPDGVFWWGFYENRDLEQFFEAALNYLSGGHIDPTKLTSAYVKAQVIGAMLGAGRYLFILDGLEVLQHSEGDNYGLLTNNSLRELLSYFAAGDHKSFCLVTSRVTLLDLIDYITCKNHDVNCLSKSDGRDLLRKIGVQGTDPQLEQVASTWDGHALTLSLVGTYLAEHCNGSVDRIADIPSPTVEEDHYSKIHKVLRWYNSYLSTQEQAFMRTFSAFRLPVPQTALESQVFRDGRRLAEKLVRYRILRYNAQENTYTTHPLIREYYFKLLNSDRAKSKTTHIRIKNYYLSIFRVSQDKLSLKAMSPVVEIVHHLCQADQYDDAIVADFELDSVGGNSDGLRDGILTHYLGAYETQLLLMREFFPEGDLAKEPLVSNPNDKRLILNEIGFSLEHLGFLKEALSFFERGLAITTELNDGVNSCIICGNISMLYRNLGVLSESENFIKMASKFIRTAVKLADIRTLTRYRLELKMLEIENQASQSWIFHLYGKLEQANSLFAETEASYKKFLGNQFSCLPCIFGVYHADHLRRIGQFSRAQEIAEANLKLYESYLDELARNHRVLGDIANDLGDSKVSFEHYNQSLKIARSTSDRGLLIEVLLARGTQAAKQGNLTIASGDLNEALEYAIFSGYRIYEASIRVGLAWMHLVAGDSMQAKIEVQQAKNISEETNFYWGKVDSAEVLKQIS